MKKYNGLKYACSSNQTVFEICELDNLCRAVKERKKRKQEREEERMDGRTDSCYVINVSFCSCHFSSLELFEKMEKRLPKEKLHTLCHYEPLLDWVRRSDYAFYQALVEVLIPDVLRPIPSKP